MGASSTARPSMSCQLGTMCTRRPRADRTDQAPAHPGPWLILREAASEETGRLVAIGADDAASEASFENAMDQLRAMFAE